MKTTLKSAANLGWEINLEVQDGAGSINSNLTPAILGEMDLEPWNDCNEIKAAASAIESMVLALACAGFDNHDMLIYAVDTTVEAICNNFD